MKIFLGDVNQKEKSIIFCATQAHALAVRDLINQNKQSKDPNYCQRVTADDGDLGDQYLKEFQDNEKTVPTVLTTSQKLSTGLDARNVRNIVLMRPINSIIEFKQIIGRGTRLFDGKERESQHMMSTSFWSAEGKPISAEQFLQNLFGKLPEFFTSEDELRDIWSSPITRKALLEKLAGAGFGKAEFSIPDWPYQWGKVNEAQSLVFFNTAALLRKILGWSMT